MCFLCDQPVLVICLWGAGLTLGVGSGWLFSSLVEDLFVLVAILVEPSLLVWSRTETDMNMWYMMSWTLYDQSLPTGSD